MLLNTPLCDFGWQAVNFTLKDPTGRSFEMKDYLGDNGLLIAFICNHCPYVKAIGERFAQDTNDLMAEGINVIAVMSNDYHHVTADSPENMIHFSDNYGFKFPYLIDENQSVGKAYGAVCTPDFFGFNKEGCLQYRGRLDNANMKNTTERSKELVTAMRQIAATGKGPTEQFASMGCSIKWNE